MRGLYDTYTTKQEIPPLYFYNPSTVGGGLATTLESSWRRTNIILWDSKRLYEYISEYTVGKNLASDPNKVKKSKTITPHFT